MLTNSYRLLTILTITTGILLAGCDQSPLPASSIPTSEPTPNTNQSETITMQIQSSQFDNQRPIPDKYTCDGNDTSPPLKFVDVPAEAKSLALIVDDPDAPTGTWVHWVVYNIASDTNESSEAAEFTDSQLGTNDFDKLEYGGPCPPSGTHRYFFKLYALDQKIEHHPTMDKATLLHAMEAHIIDQAELVGIYTKD